MSPQDQRPDLPQGPKPREDMVYGSPPGAGDWKRIVRMVALAVVVVYAVLFFLMNRQDVAVSLVVTTVNVPLVWILIGTFLAGALAMYLLLHLRRRVARKAAKR